MKTIAQIAMAVFLFGILLQVTYLRLDYEKAHDLPNASGLPHVHDEVLK